MKSLRTLTAGERRRITDGDPADLDVVELLARREWDRLEFTRRAGLLIVRPMNGSSRGGVSVYSDDVTDSAPRSAGSIFIDLAPYSLYLVTSCRKLSDPVPRLRDTGTNGESKGGRWAWISSTSVMCWLDCGR